MRINRLNRRELLRQSVQAGCVAGSALALGSRVRTARGESPPTPDSLPIVDTHQHLWDLEKLPPPWLKGAADVLRRSYVTKDYLEATQGLNVVKAVYMEIALDPQDHVAEAEYVIDLCRSGRHPTVAAVISGRPDTVEFRPYILKYRDNPFIKGVRQVLHSGETPPGFCLRPEFVRSMQLLGEIGMSFDLCLRPDELGDGVRLVDQCRDTRFILDHCGNADVQAFLADRGGSDQKPSHDPDLWRRNISELAKRDNVICKISGIVARVPAGNWTADLLAPIINHCLDSFGPDRVVFGGDWPVCLTGASYRRWVEALREVIRDRSPDQQRRLLHDNAVRFYSL